MFLLSQTTWLRKIYVKEASWANGRRPLVHNKSSGPQFDMKKTRLHIQIQSRVSTELLYHQINDRRTSVFNVP